MATGCATRPSVRRLQDDVQTLRFDLTALRNLQALTAKELARTQSDLHALEVQVAEMRAGVGEELGRVTGRLETAEQELQRMREIVHDLQILRGRGRLRDRP